MYCINYTKFLIIQLLICINYWMQSTADLSINQSKSIFPQFPNFNFKFPNIIVCKNPISSIFLQNENKQSAHKTYKKDARGKWTKLQHGLYLQYLKNNQEKMDSKLLRKSQKVFLNMSITVETRTAEQCRSHHQKILKYHGKIQEIITHYSIADRRESRLNKELDKRSRQTELIQSQQKNYKIEREANKFRIQIRAQSLRSYQQ